MPRKRTGSLVLRKSGYYARVTTADEEGRGAVRRYVNLHTRTIEVARHNLQKLLEGERTNTDPQPREGKCVPLEPHHHETALRHVGSKFGIRVVTGVVGRNRIGKVEFSWRCRCGNTGTGMMSNIKRKAAACAGCSTHGGRGAYVNHVGRMMNGRFMLRRIGDRRYEAICLNGHITVGDVSGLRRSRCRACANAERSASSVSIGDAHNGREVISVLPGGGGRVEWRCSAGHVGVTTIHNLRRWPCNTCTRSTHDVFGVRLTTREICETFGLSRTAFEGAMARRRRGPTHDEDGLVLDVVRRLAPRRFETFTARQERHAP